MGLVESEILTQNDCVWWICPICAFAITGDDKEYARFNYWCPDCGCGQRSGFIPVGVKTCNKLRLK